MLLVVFSLSSESFHMVRMLKQEADADNFFYTAMTFLPSTMNSTCPGCGAILPALAGPTHDYMESSPACWATYGEVLTREYSDVTYRAVHRLTVDTYAVQHPGQPSPQSIQSVGVHLISMYLVLELGYSSTRATAAIQAAVELGEFEWLEPPRAMGAWTVAHAAGAANAIEHIERVREWAMSAWAAWGPHHEQIKEWAAQAIAPRAGSRP
jgi:hypothetical protein